MGELRKYNVPVRNGFLSTSEKRNHTLRIANAIGASQDRFFVIAIDGIDHAARSGKYNSEEARKFFASLPSPKLLESEFPNVRLLISGQPAAAYLKEYPNWLSSNSALIKKAELGYLSNEDILVLVKQCASNVPKSDWNKTVEVIGKASEGNTLAVVFGVHEASQCDSPEKLENHLNSRLLGEGLQSYYETIWTHALDRYSLKPGMAAAVGTALAHLTEPVTAAILKAAFPDLEVDEFEWNSLLSSLAPLITENQGGFAILHNDVRVFLHSELGRLPSIQLEGACSKLADYYREGNSAVKGAHYSIASLLRGAKRESEWSTFFDIDWVLDGVAIDEPFEKLLNDCRKSFEGAIATRDWPALNTLCISARTLSQWDHIRTSWDVSNEIGDNLNEDCPVFFSSEGYTLQPSAWTKEIVTEVFEDLEKLRISGEFQRACTIFETWFGNLSVKSFFNSLNTGANAGAVSPFPHDRISITALLEDFGRSARFCEQDVLSGFKAGEKNFHKLSAFERGWIKESVANNSGKDLDTLLNGRFPSFKQNIHLLIASLAEHGAWKLVGDSLVHFESKSNSATATFLLRSTWWIIESGRINELRDHLEICEDLSVSLPDGGDMAALTLYDFSKSMGFVRVGLDTSEIARSIIGAFGQHFSEDERRQLLPILEAGATIGRLKVETDSSSSPLVRPSDIVDLLEKLCSSSLYRNSHYSSSMDGYSQGSESSIELVEIALNAGSTFRQKLREFALEFQSIKGRAHAQVAWAILHATGELHVLETWAEGVFGNAGSFWEPFNSLAEEDLEFYRELGELSGKQAVFESALSRAKNCRVFYTGNKEYSFDWAMQWFRELSKVDPNYWRTDGLKLLSHNRECPGDNRLESDVDALIAGSAIKSGPDHFSSLLCAPPHSDCRRGGLDDLRCYILEGIKSACNDDSFLSGDRVSFWCLILATNCSDDQESISQLNASLRHLVTNLSAEETSELCASISEVSPGLPAEVFDMNEIESEATIDEQESVSENIDSISSFPEIWKFLHNNFENGAEDWSLSVEKVINRLSHSDFEYDKWELYSESDQDVFNTLFERFNSDQKWKLIECAIVSAFDKSYWHETIPARIQTILLSRAKSLGSDELKSGLQVHLDFHSKLFGGKDVWMSPAPVIVESPSSETTWDEAVGKILVFFLNARGGKVIESALHGISALIRKVPEMFLSMIGIHPLSDWQKQWLCAVSEAWIRLNPDTALENRAILDLFYENGSLSFRIQAWICKCLLAQIEGEARPGFPTFSQLDQSTIGLNSARGTIHTEPDIRGSTRFVNDHESIRSILSNIETVTGTNLSYLQKLAAGMLYSLPIIDIDAVEWPESLRESEDTYLGNSRSSTVLDAILTSALHTAPLPDSLEPSFAFAFMPSDEPSLFGYRGKITSQPELWPKYDNSYNSESDEHIHKQILTEFDLPEGFVTLAGSIQTANRDKYRNLVFWNEIVDDEFAVIGSKKPTTMNGRVFYFALDKIWGEPPYSAIYHTTPLVFFAGGHQLLPQSSVAVYPASFWRQNLKWEPSFENPLKWYCDGVVVAKYEIVRGPVASRSLNHWNVPLLHRWVVRESTWNSLKEKYHIRPKVEFEKRDQCRF